MGYADFSLARTCGEFDLNLSTDLDLFADVEEVEPSALLREILADSIPLATALGTEKARSEFLIAPILAEIRRQRAPEISLFSGFSFEVDRARGLHGYCDFLLARSPIQLFLQAPVLAVVEAKNEDMIAGYGQCAAEMVAARVFNERAGRPTPTVYGAVTTGNVWKFLRLDGSSIAVDRPEYHVGQVGRILGILSHCVEGGNQAPKGSR